jgi:hypothetical protein
LEAWDDQSQCQYDSANSDHGSWCEAIVVIVIDTLAVEQWIRGHAEPVGAMQTVHEQPWATVLRVPLADGVAWFKACAPVQAFDTHLTAELSERWPDRVAQVLGYDEERAWLLLADAGRPVSDVGNPPEAWLGALPRYAELQHGEATHAQEHLAHGVPTCGWRPSRRTTRSSCGSICRWSGTGSDAALRRLARGPSPPSGSASDEPTSRQNNGALHQGEAHRAESLA